jgi:hypothetical protein
VKGTPSLSSLSPPPSWWLRPCLRVRLFTGSVRFMWRCVAAMLRCCVFGAGADVALWARQADTLAGPEFNTELQVFVGTAVNALTSVGYSDNCFAGTFLSCATIALGAAGLQAGDVLNIRVGSGLRCGLCSAVLCYAMLFCGALV